MKTIEFKDILPHVKSGMFKYYNFYNVDLDLSIFYATRYYLNSKEPPPEKTPQIIHKLFLDIESYQQDRSIEFSFTEALHPVSAISFYHKKIFYAYFLNLHNVEINIPEWEKEFQQELINNNYIKPDETVQITVFDNELELLIKTWEKIRELDPAVLSGWNCHRFDFPYVYKRMLLLTNNDTSKVNNIVSRFGVVKQFKTEIDIAEYNISDLQYLYMPRDDGGRNYGERQVSYSLDYVSDEELKLKKFEYKSKNIDLNDFYDNDPKGYLFYNIVDVVLCVRLDDKLKHIELNNDIRRKMKCGYTSSLIGQSAIFDSFVLSQINKKFRFGVTAQHSKLIDEDKLTNIPSPRTDTKHGQVLSPITIKSKDYISLVQQYSGGYVKQPIPKIVNTGTIFSLDATSMYPNIMLQHNISFDVYKARVLPPTTYRFLQVLDKLLGKTTVAPNELYLSIFDFTTKYIKTDKHKYELEDVENKKTIKIKELYQQLYYIAAYLLKKIFEAKLPLKNILNPSNNKEQIILSFYLLHLLDVLNIIHTNYQNYNAAIYSYLLDDKNTFESKYPELYIIQDVNTPYEHVIKLSNKQAMEYLNKYIITISGCCFLKHEEKLGIFTNMLESFSKERKQYQTDMKTFVEGSEEWTKLNHIQNIIKIVMNSNYGIQGQKSNRFANFHLAHTITTQGRFVIKLAQHITETYLENKFDAKSI